jgi:hypothetical protein
VGGADDDVGDGGGDADLDARVALLGQLALEELVQLGIEDTVWEVMLVNIRVRNISDCVLRLRWVYVEQFSSRLRLLYAPRQWVRVGGIVPATNFLRLELSIVSIDPRVVRIARACGCSIERACAIAGRLT